MAKYDYRCTACGEVFEVEHPMSEHPEVTCPKCASAAERVFSASAITFTGSGFYNTDQRGGSSSTSATSAKADTSDSASSSSPCANCAHNDASSSSDGCASSSSSSGSSSSSSNASSSSKSE